MSRRYFASARWSTEFGPETSPVRLCDPHREDWEAREARVMLVRFPKTEQVEISEYIAGDYQDEYVDRVALFEVTLDGRLERVE